ncbi:hypothetical protein HKCCE2091_20995 [Rhodobacterales bacterium HKCCE2091]|nr:hypothetical protein [Rhodobacterales bacterium HKCCE2091]
MSHDRRKERLLARRARRAALAMALTMVTWMGAQLLGARLGWDPRLSFLFDIAAIVALVWALYVTYQIYRARRDAPPPDETGDDGP